MADVVAQLAGYAAALADQVPVTPSGGRQPSPRRRSRVPALVAAAVLVATSAAVAMIVTERSADRVPVEVGTTAPVATSTTTASATTTTEPELSPMRVFPVIAVTDSEYLVWAGEAGSDSLLRSDGFAVDLDTGAVRPIPPAPIPARSGATGVWTGTELIVCCGFGSSDGGTADTRSAAAWNPITSQWRTLAPPPASVARSYPTAVWTGTAMVVIATGPAAATYDPSTDTWTEIPPPPVAGRLPESAWTGQQVVVWDSNIGLQTAPPGGDIADRGWAWSPGTDEWTALPPLPDGQRTQLGSMVWTGTEIVIWGQSTSNDALGVGARWRPGDNSWRPVPPSPQGPVEDPYDGTPGSQALAATTDGHVIVKDIGGSVGDEPLYVYEPDTDQWATTSILITGYHPDMTAIGGRIYIPNHDTPVAGTFAP